jgi:HEAT repeat protein
MKTMNRMFGALAALAFMAPTVQAQDGVAAQRAALASQEVALGSMRANMAGIQAALGGVQAAIAGSNAERVVAPEAWLQEDPGARAYRAAREALNARRYREAAEFFAQMRADYPQSGYVPDSYYYQAFAMYREQSRESYQRAMELLRHQLQNHPDASTRADADELRVRIEAALARRGDSEAAAAIAQQAQDPCGEEQEVRLAALSALLNMNAERAVPILQEVLRSRDECSVELRRRAVFLISQHMTEESVDVLVDLAHRNPDPDPEVREQAVFWLSQVQSEEALGALMSILRETDDENRQERAIFAISQHGGEEAVAVLRDFAQRSDAPANLRETAIFWIGQSGTDGMRFLMDLYQSLEDPELKERAVFGIAQSGGDEARAWLMERAMARGESIEVRKNALFWAGQAGGILGSELQELYDSLTDPEMKEQVIFVASQTGESEAVDFLMHVATNEDDSELRTRAIFWLGQIDDDRVAEFLLTLIGG